MRLCPIRPAVLAAGLLLSSPAFAAEDYPLPLLAGAAAYSETSYEGEWEESWDGEEYDGEVVYMDDLEDGEEWRSGGGETRVETIIRRDPRPLPPPRTGEPARGGDHRPGYGEAERGAWLAECRSRMSQGRDYSVDACADYLARYEAGTGGYGHDYGYGEQAAQGCGSCGCKGNCGGCGGGCGCSVSYRFAPMPVMQVAQRQQARLKRTITTEEWVEEETPRQAVRVIPPPPAPTKLVPVAPAPAKPIKPRYSK